MSQKAAVLPLGAVIRRIIIKTRCVGTSFQTVDKPLDYIKMGSQGRSPRTGRQPHKATASCSGFVWLTASILAWTRGGSPFPRERGLGIGIENKHFF